MEAGRTRNQKNIGMHQYSTQHQRVSKALFRFFFLKVMSICTFTLGSNCHGSKVVSSAGNPVMLCFLLLLLLLQNVCLAVQLLYNVRVVQICTDSISYGKLSSHLRKRLGKRVGKGSEVCCKSLKCKMTHQSCMSWPLYLIPPLAVT